MTTAEMTAFCIEAVRAGEITMARAAEIMHDFIASRNTHTEKG